MTRLNLGCGFNHKDGFINCDNNPDTKPDLILDLERLLPWESGTVDYVLGQEVFEHIRNFVPLMKEIHRILKPGGILEAMVPSFPCRASIADPDHVRFFVPESFDMFCDPTNHPYFTGAGLFNVKNLKTRFTQFPDMTEQQSKDFFTEVHVTMEKVEWFKASTGMWIIKR